ncbi:PREDICTED: soluble lamin-associated protein of 75 kDa [Mesitornis unicolor]|uniref:soluble lamin-associated protein of 75 kDa n=1 Tax=Mesitornis unicolor TaxID=54374 RepID=UPI0005281386|nr:PREDICTED: soluble lamin-associated protein of 75 kDa [Mesitornis unicolor]
MTFLISSLALVTIRSYITLTLCKKEWWTLTPRGYPRSVCSSYRNLRYRLPVLDTMFVRRKHRGKDTGLLILEDFVDSFTEDLLGLRYPMTSFMYTACKQYLEKYPMNHSFLWEVEGAGHSFQRRSINSVMQREKLKTAGQAAIDLLGYLCTLLAHILLAIDQLVQVPLCQAAFQPLIPKPVALYEMVLTQPDSQKGKESRDVYARTSKDPKIAPAASWVQDSHLKHPRIGKKSQESKPETSQEVEENTLPVSESRVELPAHTAEGLAEDLEEVPEEDSVEMNEVAVIENKGRSVSEAELHASPPEKQSEEETPSEPLNGEVTEKTGKTSLTAEEETANEVPVGESKLQSESQGEEPLTLFVPVILESAAKPSEDTASEKVLNANDSEVLTEESTLVEEVTEEQQDPEKTITEDAAALALKEEPSDNCLPNSMVIEAAAESASENILPKTASSLEDQNEEAGHNSQEAPVTLTQSSLIVVELEGVPFQQASAQEGQKNQLEEHLEESVEVNDQYMQTTVERAADSSSEEAEIEVPIVDRRNLRRKTKGYKGPPKKKGKLA